MSKIMLTENVEDWEAQNPDRIEIIAIHIPSHKEILETPYPAIVHWRYLDGKEIRCNTYSLAGMYNGAGMGKKCMYNIVPRKKEVPFTVGEVVNLWETQNPVFRHKYEDDLLFRITSIVYESESNKYVASKIIGRSILVFELDNFAEKYYYLKNGEWCSLTKKV